MFSIGVEFKSGRAWGFLFRQEREARQAHDELRQSMEVGGSGMYHLTDEFGSSAIMRVADVSGCILEDMSKTSEAGIERGLNNARSQASLNRRAQADPQITSGVSGVMPGDMSRINGPLRFS